MNKIINVTNLKKNYGSLEAVRDVSFYVEQGKLFAFLGPNGAGKSTTIDILCTLLERDSGVVEIGGHILGEDDNAIRSDIGVVFQDSVLDPLLTVRENLTFRGGLYGFKGAELKERIQAAAENTGINDFIDRPYGKLSGGQRRRADIARALVNMPKILFLDEPTTGLDPQTRSNIWATIRRLQRENETTVFLTTHYMEEAADADYVIVIDSGEIAARGTPEELKEQYSSDILKIESSKPDNICEILNTLSAEYTQNGSRFIIKIEKTTDSIDIIEKCREFITMLEVQRGTMDDVFMGITGREIRE